MDLKNHIIEKSKELGIDIIGFTNTEPFENIKDFLLDRRSRLQETEFEEKDLELRYNPKRVFPEGKTIIVIGISYNVDNLGNKNKSLRGRLSKSSWGIDYHKVLDNKLELLVKSIKEVKDFNYMKFVDTGPLIDREIGKRAGIGWYGKNCSIINDEYGSFIFLGYILTDLELEIDKQLDEKCVECDLCIKACPTNAIEEGYRINTKKCISYLTQTKERIPYDLRDKMGIKIYGCDTCQLVCPNNKDVVKSKQKSFLPEKTSGYIDIEELLTISNREFKEKYGHMAGSWRGRNILRRNCIIALGNTGIKKSFDLVKPYLNDDSPMIREYVAWALLKIDKGLGEKLVYEQIDKEKNTSVKDEMKSLIDYFNVL